MAQNKEITEEQISQKLSKARIYTFAYLIDGPKIKEANPSLSQKVQMDHLKYLFSLKEAGKIALFGPLTDGREIHGIFIFNTDDKEEVKKMLDGDPQVKAGWTSYKIHLYYGLPGDNLPEK